MISLQTSSIISSQIQFLDVKNSASTASKNKKNKNHKKKKSAQLSAAPAKEIAQQIASSEKDSQINTETNLIAVHDHEIQAFINSLSLSENQAKNETTKSKNKSQNKVLYERKDPIKQDQLQQVRNEQNDDQKSESEQISQEQTNKNISNEEVAMSQNKQNEVNEMKGVSYENNDKGGERPVEEKGIIGVISSASKSELQQSKDGSGCLSINTENRKKAEREEQSTTPDLQALGSTQTSYLLDQSQDSNNKLYSTQIKGNIFYTPQKKQYKKQEVQQYYYQQFNKRGGIGFQAQQKEKQLEMSRKFTQSPIFTRQRENEEEIKKKRQEDRLQMLTEVLIPQSVMINSYLDMGCGNCEISAEIGKVYGVNLIVGCDIYSEDQFIRPIDTPTATAFTYISNTNDSLQPIKDKSIDLITCFMVLHHIEALDKNLRELQRVIRDGGYLYIREHDVPSHDKELDSYLRYKHERFDDCGQFMKFWGKNDLIRELDRFGFIHSADSLYCDSRPNRQKVYHSLFKFNQSHFDQIEQKQRNMTNSLSSKVCDDMLKQIEENLSDKCCKKNKTIISDNNNINNLFKEDMKYQSPIMKDSKSIGSNSSDFSLGNESSLVLNKQSSSSNSSSSMSGRQEEKSDSTTALSEHTRHGGKTNANNKKNNLFLAQNNSTSATSTSTTTSTIPSDEQQHSSLTKTHLYKLQSDEIKESETSHYPARQNSDLVWRNSSGNKKESSFDRVANDGDDNSNKYKYTSNYYQYSKNNINHRHSSNSNNNDLADTNSFTLYGQKNFNQSDNKKKQSQKNPNYRFGKEKTEYLFSYKKQRKSQVFEFDDDEENFSSNKRYTEEWKMNNNSNRHTASIIAAQKKQNVPFKQIKPVQLLDILS